MRLHVSFSVYRLYTVYVQKEKIQIEYYQNIDLNIIGAHLPIGQRGIHNKPVGVD